MHSLRNRGHTMIRHREQFTNLPKTVMINGKVHYLRQPTNREMSEMNELKKGTAQRAAEAKETAENALNPGMRGMVK